MGARSGGNGNGRYYSQFSPKVAINQTTGRTKVMFKSGSKSKNNSVTFNTVKDALTFANKLSKQGYWPAIDFAIKKNVSVNDMRV